MGRIRYGVILAAVFALSCRIIAQSTSPLLAPTQIQSRLSLYKGDDTQRELALKSAFVESGCKGTNLVEQPVPHRKQPNVICTLPGSSSSVIVVGAHFDHVSDGSGIVDNWSGASLLPSLFQSLSGVPHVHTFIFIGFTGEEDGLFGSNFYAKHLTKDEIQNIDLMVNLDTLGLGPTEVWGSHSDDRALRLLATTSEATRLPVSGVDVDEVGESDEESFIAIHVPTITFHSLTQQTLPILHTSSDSPKQIRFQDYYDSYRLIAAYLIVVDAKWPSSVAKQQ